MCKRIPRPKVPSIDTIERATRVFCQLCGALARLALYLALAFLIFRVAECGPPSLVIDGAASGDAQEEILILTQNQPSVRYSR